MAVKFELAANLHSEHVPRTNFLGRAIQPAKVVRTSDYSYSENFPHSVRGLVRTSNMPPRARRGRRSAHRAWRLATAASSGHSEMMTATTDDVFNVFALGRSAKADERVCDWPGCREAGGFRAPKSRTRLNDYHWFCLEHVRPYNKAWNFCAGMTDNEVEASIRSDTTWNRPTWPLGVDSHSPSFDQIRRLIEAFDDPDGAFAGTDTDRAPATEAEKALAVLELRAPIDVAAVKARYKVLVKRHHPDANGGTKASEEKFKQITRAYETVMNHLTA